MTKNIYRKYNVTFHIYALCVAGVLLSGCTQEEVIDQENGQRVLVPIEISYMSGIKSKAIGDPTHTVDRILVLPFKKIDEGAGNSDDNFSPDYTSAVQYDVNSFNYASMLSLPSGATYKVVVIGYNRNDYDLAYPESSLRRFSINSDIEPELLDNLQIEASEATDIPEMFVTSCTSFNGAIPAGEYFKSEDITSLTGDLNRVVSGLSLEISGIPAYVKSITLVAETLVKSIRINDTIPVLWQTAGVTVNNILGVQIPNPDNVSFGKYLLPTFELYQTKLFLDISYGEYLTRYEVKVPDTPGISSGNSIIFRPNQAVRITGEYDLINIGFQIDYVINLEDDEWDGIS